MKVHFTLVCACVGVAWSSAVLTAEDFLVSPDFVSPMVGFFEAGVICAQDGYGVRHAPDTIAGTTHVVEDAPPFVSNGRVVPAVLGIGFGVRGSGFDLALCPNLVKARYS
jgi:hypothetical protein